MCLIVESDRCCIVQSQNRMSCNVWSHDLLVHCTRPNEMQLRTDYITTTSLAAASVGLGPRLGIDVNFEYPRPRALSSALATLCYSQGRSGILSDVDISRFQSPNIMHPGWIKSPLSSMCSYDVILTPLTLLLSEQFPLGVAVM